MSESENKKPRTIPAEAQKVFEGVMFDVYQWPQPLFDGSIATFEMLKRRSGATIIASLPNGKLLLEEDEQPARPIKTTFPGGAIEDGETPEEGARRELLEETGYEPETMELWREEKPVAKMDWTVYIYIARGCRKVKEPKTDAGERITTREVTLDEVIALAEEPHFQNKEIAIDLIKARYDSEERKKLEEVLFG